MIFSSTQHKGGIYWLSPFQSSSRPTSAKNGVTSYLGVRRGGGGGGGGGGSAFRTNFKRVCIQLSLSLSRAECRTLNWQAGEHAKGTECGGHMFTSSKGNLYFRLWEIFSLLTQTSRLLVSKGENDQKNQKKKNKQTNKQTKKKTTHKTQQQQKSRVTY